LEKKQGRADPALIADKGWLIFSKSVPLKQAYQAFSEGHINHKAVFHITFPHAFIRFINILNLNHFDIGSDAMFATEIKHFLGLSDAADERTAAMTRNLSLSQKPSIWTANRWCAEPLAHYLCARKWAPVRSRN
jgi:hypothetical protein